MRTFHSTVALAALLLCLRAADAHHAVTPVYDVRRTVTQTGVVSAFKLVNPHSTITLDVTVDAGNVVKWTIELDGRLNLTRFGWTEQTIPLGERVTVTGNPTHDDSPRMSFGQLEKQDGTRIVRPIVDHVLGTLEDARRQRAQRQE